MLTQTNASLARATPEAMTPYRKECQRIRFELWAKSAGADLTRTGNLAPAFGIEYLNGYTQAAWSGWLNCAGLTS